MCVERSTRYLGTELTKDLTKLFCISLHSLLGIHRPLVNNVPQVLSPIVSGTDTEPRQKKEARRTYVKKKLANWCRRLVMVLYAASLAGILADHGAIDQNS